MIKTENHLGEICISDEYLRSLIGCTVTSCFGVAAMNHSSASQGFLGFFSKKDKIDKGIALHFGEDSLTIDLHITVTFGTNIGAISDSIVNKVRYNVEEATGFTVDKINVFVDEMKV